MEKNKLAIVMIVKDEENIILETFKNLIKHISSISAFYICDTGSSDNTVNLIKDFFSDKDIDLFLFEEKWVDFSFNRNFILEKCKKNKNINYVMTWDADDRFAGGEFLIDVNAFKNDVYSVLIKASVDSELIKSIPFNRNTYIKPLVFKKSLKSKWVGVIHEVLEFSDENLKSSVFGGDNLYVQAGHFGAALLHKPICKGFFSDIIFK